MLRTLVTAVLCAIACAVLLSCGSEDTPAPASPVSPTSKDTFGPYMTVTIETAQNVIQGQITSIPIVLDSKAAFQIGGFDLLVAYDNTALSLTEITNAGSPLFDACGWEYFTYRFGADGNCDGNCPGGLIRIVAIAETNNGELHPSCYTPPISPATLFTLKFLVSNDRTLECQMIPVRFWWFGCSDNAFATTGGDTLLLSRYVYVGGIGRIDNGTIGFPTYQGTQDSCTGEIIGGPVSFRAVDFYNGGVETVCHPEIDVRGDLNLNAINYEVEDLMLFRDYFLQGLSVFTINQAGQIASTDVNADGLTLTMADYMTMADITFGNDYHSGQPAATRQFAFFRDTLSVDSALGAALIVFEGDVIPELLIDDAELYHKYNAGYTRVLVTPPLDPPDYGSGALSFSGPFLRTHARLTSIEAACPDGRAVIGKILPDAYGIGQNYPNPFDDATTIPFYMPEAGWYSVVISDAAGEQIVAFAASVSAGYHEITWDAREVPAGVYAYTFKGGGTEQKRLMIKIN